MRRTGLPARDLRALDPALATSYPSSVMPRDRAVVVNLERVRAVITAAEVLVPGPRDPAVAPLVRELRARLITPASGASPAPPQEDDGAKDDEFVSPRSPGQGRGGKDGQVLGSLGSDKVLPFEFRALEVCLEFACKSLEHETSTLEKEAYPALDELTSKVSTLNLERVRQIKSRLVAISGRVQKVRDELEHLLDDDMDMAAMHLTEKLAYQAAGRSSRLDTESEFYEQRNEEVEEGDGSSEGGGSNETSVGFTPKIDELEILLEAYFVQVDGTLNKLTTLREYVDDTEDYINIMLDDKQNQLLQMGIMLSTGTLVLSCAIAATGVEEEDDGDVIVSPRSPGEGRGGKEGQALGSDKVLPFEFRALEVCLEFACKSLEHETSTLEKEAYPALDELTSKVSTLNLERVRQIKNRLVAISVRVQKVRDELEHLLDDDMDMAAMHLTEKLAYQAAGRSSRFSTGNEQSEFYEERVDEEVEEGDGSSEGGNGNGTSVSFTPKIDELEILLEAYFVQIDGTLNKLSTLREYVDDTEDYINIMLDDKQNQLLQMGIVLSTGTLVVSCAITVTGVFGINVHIPLYKTANMALFWQATGGIVGAGAAIFLAALFCYRRSGILQ
ncbi:hypothetical protein EJB05_37950, partial [Eragrostis curvula]